MSDEAQIIIFVIVLLYFYKLQCDDGDGSIDFSINKHDTITIGVIGAIAFSAFNMMRN